MLKKMVKIDARRPQKAFIKQAAKILQKDGLVVFPTETVYGLGANAFSSEALKKIFAAKGRPSDNPLIVHIAQTEELKKMAKNIPKAAKNLMEAFWPGPLTLVLVKKKIVPYEVSAGLKTVAVRMPAHPVARALIQACGFPIAAPSANLSGKPSPTTALHVFEDFGQKIELILDGGKTEIGLESTVVDVTGKRVIILRNGKITTEDLARILGYKPALATTKKYTEIRSPGMKYRHYAPQVPLFLVEGTSTESTFALMKKEIVKLHKKKKRVGVLCSREYQKFFEEFDKVEEVVPCGSLSNLKEVAQNLFDCLRKFKAENVDVIVAQGFERQGIGRAIMDRLSRAATA